MTRTRSPSSASSTLPYFDETPAVQDDGQTATRARMLPPPISVPIPPSRSASPPPQSPAVVLSPSTPDFPTYPLPYDAITTVTELVPAKILPPRRAATDPLPQKEFEAQAADPDSEGDDDRTNLRNSILLLNKRVAEIERIEALHIEASGASEAGLAGVGRQRFAVRLDSCECTPEPILTKGTHSQPTTMTMSTEGSMTSLASFATSASSEDAFDIADFPSLAQLDSSYNLLDLTALPTSQQGSDERVAFPLPPALPELPPSRQSTPPPSSAHQSEETRVSRLAELEAHQHHSSGFGLGLFTEAPPAPPVLAQSVGTSSSRASSISGASSLSSKSFDASTLESSAANTSYSGATIHKEAFEQAFPPELSMSIPWFAQSPPTAYSRALPQPIDALSIDIGSAHPALASPFASSSSPVLSRVTESAIPRAESPSSATTTDLSHSALAVDRLADALDQTGVAEWVTGRSPASLLHEELVEQQAEDERKQQLRRQIEASELPRESPGISFVQGEPPAAQKTIRRFSSLGLLKKRKSEAALRETTSIREEAPRTKAPGLLKRKSDAALNSILRASRGRASDKENRPQGDAARRMPAISSPFPADASVAVSPRRAVKRSASTPKLSKLFASSASQKVPDLPSSIRGPAPTKATTTDSEPSAKPNTMKKRISLYFDKFSSGAASGQPLPSPGPPIRDRAPAGISVDVEKANAAARVSRVIEEGASDVATLEIVSPTDSTPPSALFSATMPTTAMTSSDHGLVSGSISSMAAVAHIALADKADEPAAPFSAPPTQTSFAFPTMSLEHRSRHLSAHEGPRMSISGFLKSDALQGPDSTARAQSTSSRIVFPSPKLATIGPSAFAEPATSSPVFTSDALAVLATSSPTFDLAEQQLYAPVPSTSVVAFPLLVSGRPAVTPGGDGGGDGSESDSDDDDNYGSRTSSSAGDLEEDDQPLGVVVPGALKVQKSLRMYAVKKTRTERKGRKQQPSAGGVEPNRRHEDPFELEGAAAMVSTPPRSRDEHAVRSAGVRLTPLIEPASIARAPSAGHDALLPQTDASIYRRFVSAGLAKSPPSPLEPVVAESALTIDSPEMMKRSLPTMPAAGPHAQTSANARKASKDSTTSSRSPLESQSPTTFQTASSFAGPTSHETARPALVPRASSSSSNHHAAENALRRQPDAHPDSAGASTRRHASTSSAHSVAAHGGRPALGQRSRSIATSPTGATSEQRIYLDASMTESLSVPVSDKSLAGELVALAKARGALASAGPQDGGWALWESWRTLGYGENCLRPFSPAYVVPTDSDNSAERPLREYELVNDVVRSWDVDSNALFFRRTTMWPVLSSHVSISASRTNPQPVPELTSDLSGTRESYSTQDRIRPD